MRIDKDKCMKCLMCIDECQFNAIDVDMNNESKGYKGVVINEDICMECEGEGKLTWTENIFGKRILLIIYFTILEQELIEANYEIKSW